MPKIALPLTLLAIAFACVLHAEPTHAQLRVFVAAQGNDNNPCTFALPCRTFNRAHAAVAAGGEIDVLDPAGYGSLSISKSISVQGHGFDGISPAAGPSSGIYVQAGPNDQINLNGLLIDGGHLGQFGVVFASGKSLVLANTVVRNWVHTGIAIAPSNSSTIAVTQSLVADNGVHGIYIQPPQGATNTVTATFDRVGVYNNPQNGIGIYANLGGIVYATVVDSISGANGINFYALGSPNSLCGQLSNAYLRVFRSTSSASTDQFAIKAESGAQIVV